MRDYNAIQFRSPSQRKQAVLSTSTTTTAPLSPNPVDMVGSSSTAPSSVSVPLSSLQMETAAVVPSPPSPNTHQSSSSPPSPQAQTQTPTYRSQSPVASIASVSSSPNHPTNGKYSVAQLAPADALAMRREGADSVIAKLRQQLEGAERSAASSKSAVAKSDAVILELRSTVRQLKRQLEKVQQQPRDGMSQDGSTNRDAVIGELQVQLDRAHAQILTADMIRKELEDTLEAEQYTWELRVQDQEREIAEWQQHVTVLQHDLDTVRTQWKEAEAGWAADLQHLQEELSMAQQEATHWKVTSAGDDSAEWKEKLLALEQERHELQGCLDEALKELEAVDAELQNDGTAQLREENERLQHLLREYQHKQQRPVEQQQQRGIAVPSNDNAELLEPLRHLYRWLLERDGSDDDSIHLNQFETAADLISAIQTHLESTNNSNAATAKVMQEMEQQLSVYKGELKVREESSTELRASLKEAVALLKPLQDAVAKADREKTKLQDQLEKAKSGHDTSLQEIRTYKELLNSKDDEIDQLKQEIESLELQLSKAKLVAANSVVTQHNRSIESTSSPDANSSREELRAKRQSEKALKQLLHNAQTRFNSLHQQNQEVAAINSELQGRLREAEDSLEQPSMDDERLHEKIQAHEARIRELENETSTLRVKLSSKDVELQNLQNELQGALLMIQELEKSGNREKLQKAEARVRELENELSDKTKALAAKRDEGRALNKSLKDALGLIKPLQMHLEEAEQEKRDIAQELMALKREAPTNESRSVEGIPSSVNVEAMRELENTVLQLEKENSQLQDALEDMTQSLNASHLRGDNVNMGQVQNSKNEARLREELVELKSRYEVTQGRLEDAFVENHTMVEALQKREKEESDLIQALREKLKSAEAELDNAKFIATSALVKVEELSMAEHLTLSSRDHEEIYKQKERELDHEMRLARQHRSKVPYRLA
jgi:chromosome segregation ATPase